MLKKVSNILLGIVVLLGVCGCNSSNNVKLENVEYRKAHCYHSIDDTSLSSGDYYVDIETKTNNSVTTHYLTKYYTKNVKTDFDKQILELSCLFDVYDDKANAKNYYNKSCEYENGYYVVKYDLDEEKNFDLAINELENNEYTCIEIKDQENDTLGKD